MAPSLLSKLCVCALVLASGLASDAQEAGRDTQELVLESGPLAFDGETNLFRIKAPRIRRGDLSITADEAVATGVEFDAASEWRFTGHVRIEVGTAVLNAESAVFTFEQGRPSRGELEGAPVVFSDVDEKQRSVTGNAQKMSYDYVARTLRLTDGAWVRLDKREIRGCDLIYDFAAERVTSGSVDCADLFRVRVLPDDEPSPPDPPQ